ncbi:MAG TPA: hypothetical protein VF061_09985, partial [Gemmatimonadales bacterium]
SPAEARLVLRQRLEQREADFLALAERLVYGQAASPYRELLRLAGCEYGDLERLVRQEGLEGALRVLLDNGVYLTVEEFKGRRPTVRGSATIAVGPQRLLNPLTATRAWSQSGGSRGPATRSPLDFAHVRDRAINECLVLDARGGVDWAHATWLTPGSWALKHLLHYGAFGVAPARWFSQVDPATPALHPRYRWSARVLRWGSLLAGVPLPAPEYTPLTDPRPIVRWMTDVLRSGRTPHLHTFASSAVQLCQAALSAGADLRGARLTVGSEPITAARMAVLRQAGAEPLPSYGTEEAGAIGRGCLAPEAVDDVHLLHDLHAVIQPGAAGVARGLPPRTLLFSSLRRTAPYVLLNVSMGDQAELARRPCGCPLERLGWATHLHTIRSFEKLTAGGMTFLDADVIRVLEETLPARFGGGPTDYQLIEGELVGGQPGLRLLVHPALGPLDHAAVARAFLAALGSGAETARVMGLVWRDGEFLRVQREAPRATASGKVLHLHLEQRSPPSLAS